MKPGPCGIASGWPYSTVQTIICGENATKNAATTAAAPAMRSVERHPPPQRFDERDDDEQDARPASASARRGRRARPTAASRPSSARPRRLIQYGKKMDDASIDAVCEYDGDTSE